MILVVACSDDTAERASANSTASKTPILFLGNQLTIDPAVSPELLFTSLIQAQLVREELPFRVNNAGIAGELLPNTIERWQVLKALNAQLIIVELPTESGSETSYLQVEQLLQMILRDVDIQRVLLWTTPNLGQPLPLQLAERFKVSIYEIPIKNTDWEEPETLQSQIFQQLWPAIEGKLKD
ncbi:MAG: SGNH/GDSL hydrolase family protein [Bacteroidota bacterium]